jgi:rhodanese-related sulfurtransferase
MSNVSRPYWRVVVIPSVIAMGAATQLQANSILSVEEAQAHLAAGALVVDVRTPAEFSDQNLPTAINVPLSNLTSEIEKHAPDKSTVVLLHCRSGRRSEIAESELRAMGYDKAFNIGGFESARSIVTRPAAEKSDAP